MSADISWLYDRTSGGVRWGLERTRELLAEVGDPHRTFRSIHIAGTNGKGSVAALTSAALVAARAGDDAAAPVGLYTSPHLISFSERVRLNGVPAPDGLIESAAERLRPTIERTGATFFEAATAIAFLCFAEAGVDLAVVEVGLGGRLDATNVIGPIACAITNVSIEHTEFLGKTSGEIAREKAGILKRGVPAVIGEADPPTLAVIEDVGKAIHAPTYPLDQLTTVEALATSARGTRISIASRAWGTRTFDIPLPGRYQARNAAVAAELLALLPDDIRPPWEAVEHGFGNVRWPGRLQVAEIRGTTWVFDVAHNPAGAAALASAIPELNLPRPIVLLFGVLDDKDWRQMLPPLLERVDASIITTPAHAPAGRRWDPARAAELAPAARIIPDIEAAVARAGTLAPHGSVVVAGSFVTVGEVMQAQGFDTHRHPER